MEGSIIHNAFFFNAFCGKAVKTSNYNFRLLKCLFSTLFTASKAFYSTSNDTFYDPICQSAWAALRISLRLLLLTGGYSEPYTALRISLRLLLLTGGYSEPYRPTDQSKTSPTDRRLFRALRSPTDQSKTSPAGGF